MPVYPRHHKTRQMFEYSGLNKDVTFKAEEDMPFRAIFTIDENEDAMPTDEAPLHHDYVYEYDGNDDIMVRE